MNKTLLPGYHAFFGETGKTYEETLQEIPTATVITIIMVLLGELNVPMPYAVKQRRILNSLFRGYTKVQVDTIKFQQERLKAAGYGDKAFELFHKEFLLAFLVRELKRGTASPVFNPGNGKEFPILVAYLKVIDEVYAKGTVTVQELQEKEQATHDAFTNPLKWVWPTTLPSLQYYEEVSPLYELLKMNCLLDFVRKQWRPALREYLTEFNMQTTGNLSHSFKNIFDATMTYDPQKQLSKLAPIQPNDPDNAKHLERLSINCCIGQESASLLDIKKHPLLQDAQGRFHVVEQEFFYKGFYRIPYFDLKDKISPGKTGTNKFNSGVGKKVIEKQVFGAVMQSMKTHSEHLYVDLPDAGAPDCYYRDGNTIFLLEMKSNILADKVIDSGRYEDVILYMDKHFANHAKDAPKGTGQIVAQLKRIIAREFTFDPALKAEKLERFTIYPLICHDDIHFGAPGFNVYIQQALEDHLDENIKEHFNVRPVTLVHLQWMFDLVLRGGTFMRLRQILDQYWNMIISRRGLYEAVPNRDTLLNVLASFDKVYHQHFIKLLPDLNRNTEVLMPLLQKAGISQANLDEVV